MRRLVGHDAGIGLAALDAVAEGHHAAAVATLTGRAVDAVGTAAQELASAMVGDHRLDVVAKQVRFTLDHADHPDAQLHEPPSDDEQVHRVATQPVELVAVDLVELAGSSSAHESATARALG